MVNNAMGGRAGPTRANTTSYVGISLSCFSCILAVGAANPATAAPSAKTMPAYVSASGHYQREVNEARFHPLNAIDGNPRSFWCTPSHLSSPADATITIVLVAPMSVGSIRVTAPLDQGAPVAEIQITAAGAAANLPLVGGHGDAAFSTPLESDRFEFRVISTGKAATSGNVLPDGVACVGEIQLHSPQGVIGGRQVTKRLNGSPLLRALVGRWAGEPFGAPESTLVLNLDGTWKWSYRPLLGGEGEERRGEYNLVGERLNMREAGGSAWVDVRLTRQRVRVDHDVMGAPNADYTLLRIQAKANLRVAGTYNDASW